jgi:tetratricopeptide (TPR) repeat protein
MTQLPDNELHDMTATPRVGTINAERVVVAREIHGGIHAQDVTVLTFPSGQGIERVFASVPAQGPRLVGRDRTFAEMRARVADGGKVALHGLPGAGKSALALALAYDEATLVRFSGGVLWAGLGPQPNADNILDLWGVALGVDAASSGRRSPTAAERAQRLNAHLQSVLGGKPFLIVLDDAWTPEAVLDFESFATPGYAVLLTTRDATLARRFVDAPARLVRVEELDEPAALELLTRTAPEAQGAVLDDLRALARAVGYLPLALVLMGRELSVNASQERWLRQTVEHLRSAAERLALTESARRPGLAGVPLSLQAVVELSLDALPDQAARTAFAELGVFAPKPADISRAAAIAVWEVSEDVGESFLRNLNDRGLLEGTGQDRFALHQVLAEVGRARLDDTMPAARHFGYYLALVDADREAWQAIGAELPQIQQAWEWAARGPGRDEQVLQLVAALRLFMERRGLRAQQRAWLERAVEAAHSLGDKAEEGRLLGSLGLGWWQLGGHGKAVDCLERALALARETGDRQSEGRHLGSLGLVLATAMLRDQAIGYYEQALAIARELGDRPGEASHLGALGLAWFEGGLAKLTWGGAAQDAIAPEFRTAIAYYEQALTIARAVGDRTGAGSHLGNLGNAWLQLGDATRALDLLGQAVAILRETGDRPNEGFHLANLGTAYQTLGNVQAARRCWSEALAIYDSYGDPRAAMVKGWLQRTEERGPTA